MKQLLYPLAIKDKEIKVCEADRATLSGQSKVQDDL
jgi:hypothetical protein